jgi:hypothetical protein
MVNFAKDQVKDFFNIINFDDKFFYMILTYYSPLKNTQNLKDMEIEFFLNSKYFFKKINFKSLLSHVNGV